MSKAKIWICITIVLCVVSAVSILLFIQYKKDQSSTNNVTDYSSCVSDGNEVIAVYPQQCKDKNGNIYTEATGESTAIIREVTSEKGVTIHINNLQQDIPISSPFTLDGEVPGSWSFEASFPVIIIDQDGQTVAQKPAELQGDWMTDAYVPFSVTLEFNSPDTLTNGSLVFRKDNPSGLPENDDSVLIPITFQ